MALFTDLEALVALNSTAGLGPIRIRQLLNRYGSLEEAASVPPTDWLTLAGFGKKIVEQWENTRKQEGWKLELELAEKSGIAIVPYTSTLYPKRLKSIEDFPLILYVKGSALCLEAPALAIVGTRQATWYGLDMSKKLARELATAGLSIISGLARGIDTAAHQGAVEMGQTIAVLGSGLHHIYPKENSALAEKIVERGALVSEYPLNMPPNRMTFPRRNRMISGMSQGTLLIEAPIDSGAMLTTKRAEEQGRPVFVLPGRADHESFRGNHLLIKRGARLIENSQEILEFMGCMPIIHEPFKRDEVKSKESCCDRQMGDLFSVEEKQVMVLLSREELSIEQISIGTGLPMGQLGGLLMGLLLKGELKERPGNIYKSVRGNGVLIHA